MPGSLTVSILLYFILPLWIMAGVADWLCHWRARIDLTAGPEESYLHLLMLVEVGLPLLAALLCTINALLVALMIVALFAHEATVYWDLRYASDHREVSPLEQMVHSFLELLPFTAFIFVLQLHWEQFLALFGLGSETADFSLHWKSPPLPFAYTISILSCVLLFDLLPYVQELRRGLRAKAAADALP